MKSTHFFFASMLLIAGTLSGVPAVGAEVPLRPDIAALVQAIRHRTDPQTTMTVSSQKTHNVSCSGGICSPTGTRPVLNVGDLARLLASGSITITTSAAAPDILINSPFGWASANELKFQAIGNVTVNRPMSDEGSGPLTIVYDANGTGGALTFGPKGHITFAGLANPLTINGQVYTLVNSISLMAREIAANPGGQFALSQSYNASGDGRYKQSPITVPFQGTFEGLGNAILHLHIESSNNTTQQYFALFQQTLSTAIIRNMKMETATIFSLTGPLGTFTLIAGGGLVADNGGTLSGDSVEANTVSLGCKDDTTAVELGGLAGTNEGTILNSDASGSVTDSGLCEFSILGGLVGSNSGLILYSSAEEDVDGTLPASAAGGLAGASQGGTIVYSQATGSAVANADAGGLVADSEGDSISRSTANVSVTSNSDDAGGLVADSSSVIDSCTANGSVVGSATAGGFAGHIDPGATVSNSTSYGAVTGGSSTFIGGFVGYDGTYENGINGMSNDGWDITTSGIGVHRGAGNVKNDPGITGFH